MTKKIISSYSATECPMDFDFKMHTHDNYEILGFIEGDALYSVEGNLYPLKKGDIMLMRRSEAHHLIPRSNARYARITVNFSPSLIATVDPNHTLTAMFEQRPLGQHNRLSGRKNPDNHWFYYLEKIATATTEQQMLIYLLPLLDELSFAFLAIQRKKTEPPSNKTFEIIAYINRHLFEELSLELICERFYISRSQLNRIFRRDTGSTVWNYIVIKRLYTARSWLLSGEKPSVVYAKCGFNDYVSFYKAYKKEFGVNPKSDQRK